VEVLKVLQHNYKDFIRDDFATIAISDNLNVPNSIELFIPDENHMDVDDDEGDPLIDDNISVPVPGPSNFDKNIQNLTTPNFFDPLDAILSDDDEQSNNNNKTRTATVINKPTSDSDSVSDSEDDIPDPRRRLRRNRAITFAQVH
jgi:hypothetical protein